MTSPGSVEADASLRLFLALRLPDDVKDAIDAWGAANLAPLRRIHGDDLHVTLAFLGRRPASDVPAVVGALRAAVAAAEPFPLAVAAWRETPSVGMLELDDPTGSACALALDLHLRLEELGLYRRERRPWTPHLTVARFRARPRLAPPLPRVRTFVPSDAAAYLSRLHPSGARYDVLDSAPLGATIMGEHGMTRRKNG